MPLVKRLQVDPLTPARPPEEIGPLNRDCVLMIRIPPDTTPEPTPTPVPTNAPLELMTAVPETLYGARPVAPLALNEPLADTLPLPSTMNGFPSPFVIV